MTKSQLPLALLVFTSLASANVVNIHLEASATNFGPNLTNFDTLASPGIDLSLDLLPGVPQALAFYDLNFTPACNAAVCNGEFVRGLNFGFVTAQDITIPGGGSALYVQPVRDSIGLANSAGSSHVLRVFPAGGFIVDISNGERLTVTVPPQMFDSVGTGDTTVSLGVLGDFLLTPAVTPVPEPATSGVILGAIVLVIPAARRNYSSICPLVSRATSKTINPIT